MTAGKVDVARLRFIVESYRDNEVPPYVGLTTRDWKALLDAYEERDRYRAALKKIASLDCLWPDSDGLNVDAIARAALEKDSGK